MLEIHKRQALGEFPSLRYAPAMKSAYELAMSRLEKEAPIQKLTDDQKRQIAEVDSEINAKIAEKKVFLEGEIAKSAGDSLAQDELRRQLASELARLEEKRDDRKERIRRSA